MYSFECAITVLRRSMQSAKGSSQVMEAGMATKDFRGLIGARLRSDRRHHRTTMSLNEIRTARSSSRRLSGLRPPRGHG